MEERQVTVGDGVTHAMKNSLPVVATQNPIEHEAPVGFRRHSSTGFF